MWRFVFDRNAARGLLICETFPRRRAARRFTNGVQASVVCRSFYVAGDFVRQPETRGMPLLKIDFSEFLTFCFLWNFHE
jgi:hypothetical protein